MPETEPDPPPEPRYALRGGSLPVAPSMSFALAATHIPPPEPRFDRRTVYVAALATLLAVAAALLAQALTALIALITNVCYFGSISAIPVSPAGHTLGAFALLIPIMGAVAVGLMARYGSKAIRGHGIPEAMEQILTNESRIPPRMTFLKPISAAISIGTGGPFGAEGPIIASGGALGSWLGQRLTVSTEERKTLLAAGAAAGMAATFGSPLAAVLLSVELLLFELHARSLIPVALACVTAAGLRMHWEGVEPVFGMPALEASGLAALCVYTGVGACAGLAAVAVTRAVYGLEDLFERLPLHWMWWPALGAVVVGSVGLLAPRTLGVGYDNISDILALRFTLPALLTLCGLKFVSWLVSLSSGTSGGTLAPLFTVGGGLGASLGLGAAALWPGAGVDPRAAALVGMAALFAGASRAVLACIVFAFEITHEPHSLLPLLAGCTAAYLVSCMLMRHTIMTEKIARRGVPVPESYAADPLAKITVLDIASKSLETLNADDSLAAARKRLTDARLTHQGFPVLNAKGALVGVLTRYEVLASEADPRTRLETLIRRPPVVVYHDCLVRQAVDHLLNHGVGRLPVVSRENPARLLGIVTRSDVLAAYRHAGRAAQAPVSS
ncbi:MAG: chloride channel protein [Planctomycetota bacterium]